AIEPTRAGVHDFRGIGIDAANVRVAAITQQVDEVPGPAAHDQDATVASLRQERQVVDAVELSERAITLLDVLGSLPERIKAFDLPGEPPGLGDRVRDGRAGLEGRVQRGHGLRFRSGVLRRTAQNGGERAINGRVWTRCATRASAAPPGRAR